MIARALEALAEGFGVTAPERGFLIRAMWVLFVTFHISWVCGWLGPMGLAPPFARSEDVEDLKRNAAVSARLGIVAEIRWQTRVLCSVTDLEARGAIERRIDQLREEYLSVTGANYPESRCP